MSLQELIQEGKEALSGRLGDLFVTIGVLTRLDRSPAPYRGKGQF